MSRIGKVPIPLPSGVEVDIQGSQVAVKGARGELSRSFHPDMVIAVEEEKLVVRRPGDSKLHRSLHGLTRSLLANMVQGVGEGFEKGLELSGVGYRVQKAGEKLVFQVGYSHPVEFSPPPGISLMVEGANRVKVQGISKEVVGQVAAEIRAIRPPDPYKGKGIRYQGERLKLKPGKAGRSARKG